MSVFESFSIDNIFPYALALAFLLGSPSLAGQWALDWPFLSQFQDLQSTQLDRVSPMAFITEQILQVGPIVLLAAAAAVLAGAVVAVDLAVDSAVDLAAAVWAAAVPVADGKNNMIK